MELSVNGEKQQLPQTALSVTDLLIHFDAQQRKAAVAVNGQFVPKSEHDTTQLQTGDTVEIVSPMQGG